MDKKELLKSILLSYINQDTETAKQDFHNFLTIKSKEIAGISNPQVSATSASEDSTQASQVTDDAAAQIAANAAAAVAAANNSAAGQE